MLNLSRAIKFFIVGAIGCIPNYIIYNMFRGFDFYIMSIYVNIGWCLGIFAGFISNYCLNEMWTFNRVNEVRKQ